MTLTYQKIERLRRSINSSQLKRNLNILIIFFLNFSCSQITNSSGNTEPCSEEERAIIKSAYDGDYQTVQKYLENGGDPMLECQAEHTTAFTYLTNSIATAIKLSKKPDLIKYYLTLDLTQEVKNDYFDYFIIDRDTNMVNYIMALDPHFTGHMFCCPECLEDFEFAVYSGYDINWQNPESGFSLLMDYAGCPSEKTAQGNIEVMKYLIAQGADINQVSDKGQNALDLAVNQDIIAFLKPLYE